MSLLEEVLYPCVRVLAEKAGGSGTIIYSKQDDESKEYHTYVLTCHHVVEDAIKIKDEWDALLGRQAKKEFRSTVKVEFFKYRNGGRVARTESVDADIIAWNKQHDVSLLKLRMDDKPPYVAKLYPKNLTKGIQLFDSVCAVGCALLHSPIVTSGIITSMSDEIDDLSYWMSDAQIIFGNSGGAVLHKNERGYEFIGIPSRVSVYGWGAAVTHLGYFSDIERIYKWLDQEYYQFLYDESYTAKQCEKLREEKRERELELYKKRVVEPPEEKSKSPNWPYGPRDEGNI